MPEEVPDANRRLQTYRLFQAWPDDLHIQGTHHHRRGWPGSVLRSGPTIECRARSCSARAQEARPVDGEPEQKIQVAEVSFVTAISIHCAHDGFRGGGFVWRTKRKKG